MLAEIAYDELRLRVVRLLRGERRPEDLSALFLSQRDKPHTKGPEKEVGDFIAHRDMRTQGQSHLKTRAFVAVVDVNYSGGTAPLEQQCSALRWAFDIHDPALITSEMGLATDRHAVLRSMVGRIVAKDLGAKVPLNPLEAKLLALLRKLAPPAVFTPRELIESFAGTLRKSSLLRPEEVPAFLELEAFVSLFAVAKMHGSELDLGSGRKAQIIAHVGPPDISTWAAAIFDTDLIFLAHFKTGLTGAEHAPELLETWGDRSIYGCLEMNELGRLVPLR